MQHSDALRGVRSAHAGAGYTEKKKELKRLIRKKKRECWSKFLLQQSKRHPWDIVRIAKDPFKCTPIMGDLKDNDDNVLSTDEEKVAAFQAHNLISNNHNNNHHDIPIIATSPQTSDTQQSETSIGSEPH